MHYYGLKFNLVLLFNKSWSPDGAHITASNATNNNGYVFTAAVITRSTWTSEISLVGHENTVEVAVSTAVASATSLLDMGVRLIIRISSCEIQACLSLLPIYAQWLR